jgi:hypothetical protein
MIPAVPRPASGGSGYVLKHVSSPYTVYSTVVTTVLTIGNCEVLQAGIYGLRMIFKINCNNFFKYHYAPTCVKKLCFF